MQASSFYSHPRQSSTIQPSYSSQLIYDLYNTPSVKKIIKLIIKNVSNLSQDEIIASFDVLKSRRVQINQLSNADHILNGLRDRIAELQFSTNEKFKIYNNYASITRNFNSESATRVNQFFHNLFIITPPNPPQLTDLELAQLTLNLLCYGKNNKNEKSEEFFQSINKEICARNYLDPEAIAQILNAYCNIKELNPEVFSHLQKAAINNKNLFTPNQIFRTLMPLMKLGIKSDDLLKAFAPVLRKQPCTTSEISPILWCYCVYKPSEEMTRNTLLPLLSHVIPGIQLTGLPQKEQQRCVTQLYQVYYAAEVLGIVDEIKWPQEFITAKDQYVPDQPKVSPLQTKANNFIAKMGYSPDSWVVEGKVGPFKPDIVNKEERVIIEIDGGHHFVKDDHRTGKDAMKNWILAGKGFVIVRLTQEHIDPLHSNNIGARRGARNSIIDKIEKAKKQARKKFEQSLNEDSAEDFTESQPQILVEEIIARPTEVKEEEKIKVEVIQDFQPSTVLKKEQPSTENTTEQAQQTVEETDGKKAHKKRPTRKRRQRQKKIDQVKQARESGDKPIQAMEKHTDSNSCSWTAKVLTGSILATAAVGTLAISVFSKHL